MKEKREYTIYHYSTQLFSVVYMLVFIFLISISVNIFYLIFVIALISIVFFWDEFFVTGKYYKMSFEKNSIKLSTWYNLLPFFKKELFIRFDDIESWYFKKNTGQKGLYHKWIIRLKNGKSIVFKTYYLSSKRPSKDFDLAFYRFVQLVKHYNEMNTKQQIECLESKIMNP